MRAITTLLALIGTAAVVSAVRPKDQVLGLPDTNALPTPWFSGYLTATPTKKLHYVFVTSQSDPQNDPIVVWFNGGPGCSSMLALFQEHGPFVIDDGEYYIKDNPYPWNQRANMLYIESPAGVGYSIGVNPTDLIHNDMTQSRDALAAIQDFYSGYSEFLSNPLYISGESYGGIYVPYLAWQIHQHNQLASVQKDIQTYNLQGFIVGNGATDWDMDISPSFPDVVKNFNIIPNRLLKNYTSNNCHFYFRDVKDPSPDSPICNELWDKINSLWQGLNWYDLFRKTYPDSAVPSSVDEVTEILSRERTVLVGDEIKTYKAGFTFQEYTNWLGDMPMFSAQQPVLGTFLSDYINRADLRRSLNIPNSVQGWNMCSAQVSSQYRLQYEASLWIYKIFLQYNYKILFFSGDTDGAVPTEGSRRWIESLNLNVKGPWRQWNTNGQVSGYLINYEGGLDFATVHGAGHMAPQWKRQEVTKLFTNWIHGEPLN